MPGGAKTGLGAGLLGSVEVFASSHYNLPEVLSPRVKRPLRDQEGGQAGVRYLGFPPMSSPVVTGTSYGH